MSRVDEQWFSPIGGALAVIVFLLIFLLLESGFGVLGQRPPDTYQEYLLSEPMESDTLLVLTKDELAARNLAAQEGVWRASYLTTVLTALQAFIAAITICLVFSTLRSTDRTLNATRDALKISEQTLRHSESSSQAHVLITVEFELKKNLVGEDYIQAKVRLGNFGQTPARDVRADVLLQPWKGSSDGVPDGPIETAGVYKTFAVLPTTAGLDAGIVLDPSPNLVAHQRGFHQDYPVYRVWTRLEYKTVFGYPETQPHQEFILYECYLVLTSVPNDESETSFSLKLTDISTTNTKYAEEDHPSYRPPE